MNWKTWLLLFLALAAGSVASFGVKMAFFTEKDVSADARSDDFTPKERLLVANGFLPSGTELNAQNVRLTLTSERDVPRDGIFTFEGVAGRKITRDIKDGESISLYDLEDSEEVQTEDVSFIPPGYVVVPIEVCSATKATGGANYLKTTKLNNIVKPGDVVDLVVVKEDVSSREKRRLVSEPVVEEVSVFAVHDENRRTSEGVARNSVLSALLSKEQVESVRKASEEGKIKIVFRSTSLSYEEEQEQSDFLEGGFYSSIQNNDAILGHTTDNVLDTPVQKTDETNFERAESDLLVQQDAETTSEGLEASDSKGEKSPFVNVSRTVEKEISDEETTTDLTEQSKSLDNNVLDDVLSDAEIIAGDVDKEKSDDVLTEKYSKGEKSEERAWLVKVRNPVAEGDAESCDASSTEAEQKNDVTQETKKKPRVFSPYATRGTSTPRRRSISREENAANSSQSKEY